LGTIAATLDGEMAVMKVDIEQFQWDGNVPIPPPRPFPKLRTCAVCLTHYRGGTCPKCGHSRTPGPITARTRRRMLKE
jgi:hypothetical protein